MDRKTLKQRVVAEMCVDDEDWKLAKEIHEQYLSRLKQGIGLSNIYNRIRELRGTIGDG